MGGRFWCSEGGSRLICAGEVVEGGISVARGASCLYSGWCDGVVRVCCAGGDGCIWWKRWGSGKVLSG